MFEKNLLAIGAISLRLNVPFSWLRRFFWCPRRYVVRVNRVRAVAEEDLPKVLADLEAEGFLKPPPGEEDEGRVPSGAARCIRRMRTSFAAFANQPKEGRPPEFSHG